MWMFRSGNGIAPIVLYHYDRGSREGAVAEAFLQGYCGYLQTDGCPSYNHAGDQVVRVGCLAHVRRYYIEALSGLSERQGNRAKKIQQGITYCDKIFSLDKKSRSLESKEEREEFRKTQMWEAFEALFVWAENEIRKKPPQGLYLKALNYTLNQKENLRNSLLDERLEVSNNRAERAIKPFVMGRKNWMFCNTARGAQSSAIIYSIVVSAMENGLNPFEYLTYVLDEARKIDLTDNAELDRLLPWFNDLPAQCRQIKEEEA
jgi:hypothetical protein